MMFLGFVIAVGVVFGLTLVGAAISKRSPGNDWQRREDSPMLGPHDHY